MFLPLLFGLLPVAATMGFWCGARSIKGKVHAPPFGLRRDYFKGLNYLINEQPDKAVDVFIRLIEVDTDTVETHLALGSLFRRRGEVERAIRVHQNIIARPNLDRQHRIQALNELGQDYLHAGVLDRAERLFLELIELGESSGSSYMFLLRIYQQEKDWEKAVGLAKKLMRRQPEISLTIAQFYCELAELELQKNHYNLAYSYLKKARSYDNSTVRPHLIRAHIAMQLGDYASAMMDYKKVFCQGLEYHADILPSLVECYQQLGQEHEMIQYFTEYLAQCDSAALMEVVSSYYLQQYDVDKAMRFLFEQIQLRPSFVALKCLFNCMVVKDTFLDKTEIRVLHGLLQALVEKSQGYCCQYCGLSASQRFWFCPGCQQWNGFRAVIHESERVQVRRL